MVGLTSKMGSVKRAFIPDVADVETGPLLFGVGQTMWQDLTDQESPLRRPWDLIRL